MAKQSRPSDELNYATATPVARRLALHHVGWEGLQLLRAHEAVRGWAGPLVQPLIVAAAAVHTRSLAHFLYVSRDPKVKDALAMDDVRLVVRDSDILAEDFGVRPTNWIDGLGEILRSCGKQVAHLMWQRVEARTADENELRRWARSTEVSQLLTQLRMVVRHIDDIVLEDPRVVARDGHDYVHLFLEATDWLLEWNSGMAGTISGSGTEVVGSLRQGDSEFAEE